MSPDSNIETARLLLEYGADPFIKSNIKVSIEAKELLEKYQWKRLYERDKDIARKYAKQTVIPKDVWELILLTKRREQLCRDLNSRKNRELLILFALEFNIPIEEKMTKAQICGRISRYLVYGKNPKPLEKGEKDIAKLENNVREIAMKFGLDPNDSLQNLLAQLGKVI